MRGFQLFVLSFFASAAPLLRADESLTPAVLKDVKGATAFVKVDAGTMKMTGSGFLIKLSGGAGYVVTNNHVIDTSKPHVIEAGPHRRLIIAASKTAEVSVVFFSGTPDELSLPAQVVAADKDRDLAILLVKGVNRQIKPIDMNVPADLVETTPIFVFGFPFGEALSMEGHNPAITVGRGTISSIRLNKKGEVGAVQIDGALNPGNSGGPVVDAKGRLAGVAVATIVGSGIGLAIPPSELKQELIGRIGTVHISATRAADKNNVYAARVTVPLVDPMGQIRAVTLYWVPAGAVGQLKPQSHLTEIPTAKRVSLKLDGAEASGSFDIPTAASGQTAIVYETSYVSGTGVIFSARSDPMELGDAAVATMLPTPDAAGPVIVPQPKVGPAIRPPIGSGEFIDTAIIALASEDPNTQTSGGDKLRIAPLDNSHRAAVLAALAPHLASDDSRLCLTCVRACVHWATVKEVPVLEKVVETSHEHAESGAAAMVGLVRLDPTAARHAFAARKSDFFFFASVPRELLKLAENEPRYADTVIQMLRDFDVVNADIKVSLSQAIQMLESDAASTRLGACNALMIAPIEPSQRKRVLELLAAHLNAIDGTARLKYLRAYIHWIDSGNIKDLRAIVDFPTTAPTNYQDVCWASAVVAMIRLGALPAAIDAYNSRGDNFWFGNNVNSLLTDLAESTAPEQSFAWSFLQQFTYGRASGLHALAEADSAPAGLSPQILPPLPAPSTPSPNSSSGGKLDSGKLPGEVAPVPAGALHGQILGKAFIPDRVMMQHGWLHFRTGKEFFADQEIKIAFRIRPGEPISGVKYHIDLDEVNKPGIFVSCKTPADNLPKTFVARHYEMDIEFGKLADDKLPGTIKLTLKGEQSVDLTGTFVADFK